MESPRARLLSSFSPDLNKERYLKLEMKNQPSIQVSMTSVFRELPEGEEAPILAIA